MAIAIIDCYTDEPAGLGVPPYLGVYPRYLYGLLRVNEKSGEKEEIYYLTIDDIRLQKKYSGKILEPTVKQKTNIATNNLTKNHKRVEEIISRADTIYFIIGVHTPGKYLSAVPGTAQEIERLFGKEELKLRRKRILCGPVTVGGSQLFGGKKTEIINREFFNEKIDINKIDYEKLGKISTIGAEIVEQIDDLRVVEIETGRGCQRKHGCSFCLEPLKNKEEYRGRKDIINEIKEFYDKGVMDFRLGKQSCVYKVPEISKLLEEIRTKFPKIRTLHIDNVNPTNVLVDEKNNDAKITKAIIKNCSSGNVAAFGIESFDPAVVKENNLNTKPHIAFEAIKIINKYGSIRGENGMPKLLPGLNIIFGLKGETKKTHEENMRWLQKIISEGLMLRRINIRTVIPYEGTQLEKEVGLKVVKKNKKHYFRWRKEIRENIDFENLKKVWPAGSVLKEVRMEIYDGNNTFGRQLGTYPLIIGVKERLRLGEFYNIKVVKHMLRSVVGEVVK